ncbi:MAG: hypothetical protein JJ975_15280 [Bacteroidia bacterium]|nr:hypothetical protein [Bacteroidia bacterium]
MKTTTFKQSKRSLYLLFTALLIGPLAVYAQTFSSVSVITVESEADCSEATFKVRYRVNTPSATGGYIVQKVHLKGYRIRCDLASNGRVDLVYYEAWPVAPGSDSAIGGIPETGTTASGQTWNDQYTMGPLNNTFGEMSWQGEVGFIANPSGGGTHLDTTWNRDSVQQTGGLLGTVTPPSWWAALESSGKLTSHDAYTSWYCCDGVNSAFILDNTYVPVTIEVDTNDVQTTDTGSTANKQKIKDRLKDLHEDTCVQNLVNEIKDLTERIKRLDEEMERAIREGEGITPEQLAERARLLGELEEKQKALEKKIRDSRTASGSDIIMGTSDFAETPVRLFPNPIKPDEVLHFKGFMELQRIDIYTIAGKKVKSADLFGAKTFDMDIGDIGSGQFMIIIRDQDGNTHRKKLLIF